MWQVSDDWHVCSSGAWGFWRVLPDYCSTSPELSGGVGILNFELSAQISRLAVGLLGGLQTDTTITITVVWRLGRTREISPVDKHTSSL